MLHIGIYGKRERESGFFRFGCELVNWVLNVYVLKLFRCMGGAGGYEVALAPPTDFTIRIVLNTSMFSLIFFLFYAVFV